MSRNVMIVLVVVVVALLFGFGLWIFTANGEQEYRAVEILVQNGDAQPAPVVVEGRGTFENPFPLGTTVEKEADPGIVHRVTIIGVSMEERSTHIALHVTLEVEILGPPGSFSRFGTAHFAVLGEKGALESAMPRSEAGRMGRKPRILTGTKATLTTLFLLDLNDASPVLIWDREIWRIEPESAPRLFFDLGLEERT